MVTLWRLLAIALALFSVLLLAMPKAKAAGGIIFDDFTVKNAGKVVFFDNFEDGSISDWTSQRDAFTHRVKGERNGCCLWLDRQSKVVSCAFHAVSIPEPGVVEVSAWVLLPPPERQAAKSFTNICIYSSSTTDNMGVGVDLHSGEKGYRVKLHVNVFGDESAKGSSHTTQGPLIFPNKWALLAIVMDRPNGIAKAFLDGKQVLTTTFDGNRYRSVNKVSVWGWLGDFSS